MKEDFEVENSVQGLLVQLIHNYHRLSFQELGEIGVHPGQLPILKTLSCRGGLSQRELANILHIKPPTVTVTVQRLEKAQLVYKQQDREDQRISRIYLTEKGESIISSLMGIIRSNEERLMRGFSDSEICLMRRFFQQMIENIAITEEDEKKNKEEWFRLK